MKRVLDLFEVGVQTPVRVVVFLCPKDSGAVPESALFELPLGRDFDPRPMPDGDMATVFFMATDEDGVIVSGNNKEATHGIKSFPMKSGW